jgi:hypothetical protein
LHLPETRKLRLILIHRLYHAQRCRRCQGCSILQARRATDDPRRRAVAPGALFPGAAPHPASLIDALSPHDSNGLLHFLGNLEHAFAVFEVAYLRGGGLLGCRGRDQVVTRDQHAERDSDEQGAPSEGCPPAHHDGFGGFGRVRGISLRIHSTVQSTFRSASSAILCRTSAVALSGSASASCRYLTARMWFFEFMTHISLFERPSSFAASVCVPAQHSHPRGIFVAPFEQGEIGPDLFHFTPS